MKNIIRIASISFLFIATIVFGAIPPISVMVSEAGGKVAYKGTTNASGAFATGNLKPGNYVVQFNANSPAVKGGQYALVISAGKKKVSAGGVSGDKLNSGGVAMKIEVGKSLNITGQIATGAQVAMKSGKKMVFIPPRLGSNLPGKWVEEGSAEAISAQNSGQIRTGDVQNLQSRGTGLSGN